MKNVTAKKITSYNQSIEEDNKEQLFDLSEGIKDRLKRRKEHEELVKKLAYYLESKGFDLYKGQIDCLAIKSDITLIFEVKTLNGGRKDERSQVLKALAQLKYYKKFFIEKFGEFKRIDFLVLFSHKISDEYIEFLEESNISVMQWEKYIIN